MNWDNHSFYQGLEVVKAQSTHDPFRNLRDYAKDNLDHQGQKIIDDYIKILHEDVEHNRPLSLQNCSIYNYLTDLQKKRVISALILDIPVLFLHRRYDLLRNVFKPQWKKLSPAELLEEYWLKQIYKTDPEVPQIIARLVVSKLTQWELMCLLYENIKKLEQRFLKSSNQNPPDKKIVQRLGRLISFLKWVPYTWVEEILLDLPFTCPLEKGSQLHLRMWISLMRSFYCRGYVKKKNIEALVEAIVEQFNAVPTDLRQYLRAVLISGGYEAWVILEKKILSQPTIFFNAFFLLTMVYIDRAATTKFVHKHNKEIHKILSTKDYLNILAFVGEFNEDILHTIMYDWNQGDELLKMTILDIIIEYRWKTLVPFLREQITIPTSISLKMQLFDALINMSTFNDIYPLLAELENQHPVLYYHVIEQCHHLLLEHPRMLTRLHDLNQLAVIESARKRLYAVYMILYEYKNLTITIKNYLADIRHTDIASVTFKTVDVKQNSSNTTHPQLPEPYYQFIRAVNHNQQWLNSNSQKIQELSLIVDFLNKAKPRNVYSIFGKTTIIDRQFSLLESYDFLTPNKEYNIDELNDLIENRLQKIEFSIALFQDYFLFKEWFIRQAPFVLHKDFEQILTKIRQGKPLYFNPEKFNNKKYKEYLRHSFFIFYECTKQGVYLTDHLLDCLITVPRKAIHERIRSEFTHRRSLITQGFIPYKFQNEIDRHLEFTTFAHIYRYGKESMDRPPIIYLWLLFNEATERLLKEYGKNATWPQLPPHPEAQKEVGPAVLNMYDEHIEDAKKLYDVISQLFDRFDKTQFRMRVIPNITYGLFCMAPIINELHKKGIHISFAGISSRYCDDINISDFSVNPNSLYPVKPYLFSTASNFGTLNHDRILIVVDGTMEPISRRDPQKARLPKAHRGYMNHLVAINYIRSKYAYGMQHPEREVAAAMHLSVRYVQNLLKTPNFQLLINSLLLSFDRAELRQFHKRVGTGHTYYSFAQWNPDGLSIELGSRGDIPYEVPCMDISNLSPPVLLFVSMNGVLGKSKVPAFFDNNPEVEKSRIIMGPAGVWLDTGWPHTGEGIVIDFPEGEN